MVDVQHAVAKVGSTFPRPAAGCSHTLLHHPGGWGCSLTLPSVICVPKALPTFSKHCSANGSAEHHGWLREVRSELTTRLRTEAVSDRPMRLRKGSPWLERRPVCGCISAKPRTTAQRRVNLGRIDAHTCPSMTNFPFPGRGRVEMLLAVFRFSSWTLLGCKVPFIQ